MLDFNISLDLSPDLSAVTDKKDDRLIITSCAVHMFEDNRIWSAFEEMCYSDLNVNNYGLGAIDFEIGFSGYSGKPYPKVFTKCFALRTDTGFRIKPMKFSNQTCDSKINQRGETVIGLRYYFREEAEINELLKCRRLMFEAYFALDNPKKTYAFMCQLRSDGANWVAEAANTYRNTGNDSIKNMID